MGAILARQVYALGKAGEPEDAAGGLCINLLAVAPQDLLLAKVTLHQYPPGKIGFKVIIDTQHLAPGSEQHQHTQIISHQLRDQAGQFLRVCIRVTRQVGHRGNLQHPLLLKGERARQTDKPVCRIYTGAALKIREIAADRNGGRGHDGAGTPIPQSFLQFISAGNRMARQLDFQAFNLAAGAEAQPARIRRRQVRLGQVQPE